jgi:hypothetical protein
MFSLATRRQKKGGSVKSRPWFVRKAKCCALRFPD